MAITRVSQEGFARHIGVSRERVRQLLAEHVIELLSDGRIDLDRARLAYIQQLRTRPVRSQAGDKLREARAAEIELRVAERARRLIEIEEAVDAMVAVCGAIRTEMGGVPARVTRDLALRRQIENAINDALGRVADKCDAEAAALHTGGAP
jgi:phage terminase Nu1 subunit (DNA packaging protein)